MSAKVYEIVTEQILRKLEEGVVPWDCPWKTAAGFARNIRGIAYRGINAFVLAAQGYSSPHWLTYNQAKARGGYVRKGEKSTPIVFWKWIAKMEEKEGAGDPIEKRIPLIRYHRVFNLQQCEGVKAPVDDRVVEHEPIEAAEAIVAGMPKRPRIEQRGTRACYLPSTDTIHMPRQEDFEAPESYYAVLFHELGHCTGHESRIGRREVESVQPFGTEDYSREELVAELTAAFLCGECGIEARTIDRSAAYIDSWLRVFKNDRKLVVHAAAAAQKATDWILDRRREENGEGAEEGGTWRKRS